MQVNSYKFYTISTHRTMKRHIRCIFFSLFTLVLIAFSGCVSTVFKGNEAPRVSSCISTGWPQDESDLKPDSALKFGRLENGLRYIIMQNHEPKNRAALYLDVQAGSLFETDSQRGLAHYIEHMVFNGSTHFAPDTLVEYFQSIGMSFGADTNAHTSYNETVYKLLLPKGDQRHLDEGLLVMADYARGALLLEREVDRERGVILAEKRSRDSVGYRLYKKRLQFSLDGTLIPERIPIGTEETIKNANSSLLRDYYDTWYRPDNMILVIVGDVDVGQVRKSISGHFALFPKAGSVPKCRDFGKIKRHGIAVLYEHAKDLGHTELSIGTRWNTAPRPDTSAWESRRLIEYAAELMLNNRLQHLVNQPGSPLTRAQFNSGIFLQRFGFATLSAETKAENWRKGLELLYRTLRQSLEAGFTGQELVRVKKKLQADFEKGVQTEAGRDSSMLAARIINHVNDNEVILSPEQELQLYGPILRDMTLDQVNRVFRALWQYDNRLIEVVGTAQLSGTKGNAEALIKNLYLNLEKTAIQPWTDAAEIAFPYLPAPVSCAQVVKKEKLGGLDALKVVFESGGILNIKKTTFRPNEVEIAVHFGAGRLEEPQPGLGILAESVVSESGLGRLTRDELDEALAGRNAKVTFHAGLESFSLHGTGLSSEFELILQLIQTQLLDPAFRPEAYRRSMERFRQRYEQMGSSVEGMMRLRGDRFLAGGNDHYGMPSQDRFMELTMDQVRNWLAPVFSNAPLEISVVGDIDPDHVIELVGRYLGTLHRKRPVTGHDLSVSFPSGQVLDSRVKSRINKSLVVVAWPTADFWNISRTRRLSVLASVLNDRLRMEMREKMGAVYSPFVYNHSSRTAPGYGVLRAMITVDPKQAGVMEQKALEVAADLAENGLDSDELKRAVEPILTSIRDMMQTNRYWLESVLALSSRHPEQLQWPLSIKDDFSAMTPDEISAVAARYLKPDMAAEIVFRPVEQRRE